MMGKRIWWQAINLVKSGIVIAVDGDTLHVRLDDETFMLVDKSSVRKWEESQSE